MEMMFNGLVYVFIIAGMFLPAAGCCWFFENTKSGKHLWNKCIMPWLVKHGVCNEDLK